MSIDKNMVEEALETIVELHKLIISVSGGEHGVRDSVVLNMHFLKY
jgi:hypothetical protein